MENKPSLGEQFLSSFSAGRAGRVTKEDAKLYQEYAKKNGRDISDLISKTVGGIDDENSDNANDNKNKKANT